MKNFNVAENFVKINFANNFSKYENGKNDFLARIDETFVRTEIYENYKKWEEIQNNFPLSHDDCETMTMENIIENMKAHIEFYEKYDNSIFDDFLIDFLQFDIDLYKK